ncbi:hypothetical protein CHU98_g2030 [Xylaria longipes]|nr:hypothetical protein CHU98_g2030 [Xylaria longipes]
MATQISLIPTPTELPASITSPPTIQFTPAPECYDPGNNWIVTTSCYIQGPDIGDSEPDWLTCTLKNFGPSEAGVSSCSIPYYSYGSNGIYEAPKVTLDGVVSYYSGCPTGFTALATYSTPAVPYLYFSNGHFDATAYSVNCCPTQYDFEDVERIFPYTTYAYTEHDGNLYSLYYYPLPGCAITSVQALSGKNVAYRTWSATRAYDKRQADVTELWDYEHGTLFAEEQFYRYTVFRGTHTCFENCDPWFTYYFPNGPDSVGTPETTDSSLLSSVPTSAPVSSSIELPVSSTPTVEETFPAATSSTSDAEIPSDIPSTESSTTSTGASTTSLITSTTTVVIVSNGSVTMSPLSTGEADRPLTPKLLVALVVGLAATSAL